VTRTAIRLSYSSISTFELCPLQYKFRYIDREEGVRTPALGFGESLHEEAFYDMVKLRTGDFELDPNFRPTEQVIRVSPESLLLEGMRRLDESGR